MLTIYGDGTAISVDGDQWLQGRLTDIELQEFYGEADAVGLLDADLDLRRPNGDEPDITARFAVDGEVRFHQFDLSEIERPVALRSFLVQSSSFNRFELAVPFVPEAWISCGVDPCRVSVERAADTDRPVLPDEQADVIAIFTEQGIDI